MPKSIKAHYGSEVVSIDKALEMRAGGKSAQSKPVFFCLAARRT